MTPRRNELALKLAAVQAVLRTERLGAVRLRGLDWFAWMTCGGSAAVLLAAETGVAEALVTPEGVHVLTDVIERDRLVAEELPPGLPVVARAWWDPGAADRFVVHASGGGRVASDRPVRGEEPLPDALVALRAALLPDELDRYRALGREAAVAATDVLLACRPDWTGLELAGAASEALWGRGIHPALTLVGDSARLRVHRHPTASRELLGERAMLVLCARRDGLVASLTRFVAFRAPTAEETRLAADVARIEAAALAASRPGTPLGAVYAALVAAYAAAGHPGEEARHHQGGPCGYLPRDALATPGSARTLARDGAVAWNPSLPGAKIEDTVLVREGGLEILTVDPRWPTSEVDGRSRPAVLVR